MGISYELSRREGRIGGPEKPLSELGKKGYTRFWEATVARFVLGLHRTSSAAAATLTLTVGEIARRCWVLPEDVIVALTSMGLLDDDSTRVENKVFGSGSGSGNGNGSGSRLVVVINRTKVREWVSANGVDLEAPILEAGFVEEEEEEERGEEGVGGGEG